MDQDATWYGDGPGHVMSDGEFPDSPLQDSGRMVWTAFLMRQLIVASRLGRTEYQLLLMKISWWDRNVKIRY